MRNSPRKPSASTDSTEGDSSPLRLASERGRTTYGIRHPLRLHVAAAEAFPDGSMTASGLRREAARDGLVIERIAGKDYTTLANIEETGAAQCRALA